MKANLRWRLAQYFEKKWWKNYLRHKTIEDYREWKKGYWISLMEKVWTEDGEKTEDGRPKAEDEMRGGSQKTKDGRPKTGEEREENGRVLDAGCGPAGIFMVLDKQKITAIDPLLDEYEKSLAHFSRKNFPEVEFITSSLEDFRRDNYFDVAYCMNVINHVQDYETAMNNLIDSLKPGGTFVFTIDAHNFSSFKYLFRAIPGDILHPHQYDLDEYKSHLTKRGVEIEKTILLKKEFFFNHYLVVGKKK